MASDPPTPKDTREASPPHSPFVHLHVHSQYSLLDGAIKLDALIKRTAEYGMDAVALTDHGAMYGALEFYLKAQKAGIKPIVGCEFYVAPHGRANRDPKKKPGNLHLVLLAMDHTGYKNLMRLATIAQLEGFYYKPRIDMEVIREHNRGLIAMTACLGGMVPYYLSNEGIDRAEAEALKLRDIFGDRLYLELQENGIEKQALVNDGLKEISSRTGIPLVATNDCHYLDREDAEAHEVLLCIQTGVTIDAEKRFKFDSDELYFKPPAVMAEQFAHSPEALAATREIADRCNLEIETGKSYFPRFPVEEGETLESMFESACRRGLTERFEEIRKNTELTPQKKKEYEKRLEYEIGVIKEMGFSGYFLIVADFINWAKNNGVPVGPGRGSGAGSLAAYCMRITDLDPIPYGLLFERFLNVERISMPDFDVDFCQEKRGLVLEYVQRKYGHPDYPQVAQIITYGTMKARGVIRDVGRALGFSFQETDRIAKMVPNELKMTLEKALEQEPKLKEARRDERIDRLIRISTALEGLARHTSTHAAGVVISPGPMYDFLPLTKGPKGELLTQYDMVHTEKTGLIKFDFLGLKTLTVIEKALDLIEADVGERPDLRTLPMDDLKTFDLLCRGDTLGVFQLESSGMRNLLVKMKPEAFTDLIALVALYRPGPLDSGMVDDYVETKHGRKKPHYPLPQLEPILKETYGVIVYQEQVMKIASVLAGYSLGQADILRRAMGKKKAEVMAEQKASFVEGCVKNGVPEDKAEYIFDLIAKFAGYGFNKSHSAAYALIAYHTAWLKAHYPAQFMAALLSCDINDTDKVVRYIHECEAHEIEVLPPDINESDRDFTVVKNRIRIGLGAIKNVGDTALELIIRERKENGPYRSFEDFCCRLDSSKVNRRVIENLIKAGAFDSTGARRSQLMAVIDQALEQAQAAQRDRMSGQQSLFGMLPQEQAAEISALNLPDIPEWNRLEKLAHEKETIGLYLSGHPLNEYQDEIRCVASTGINDISNHLGGAVRVVGMVAARKVITTKKKGERMAFITISDTHGAAEVIVFSRLFAECEHLLDTEGALVVEGTVELDERKGDGGGDEQQEQKFKIIAREIMPLEGAPSRYCDEVRLRIPADGVTRRRLEAFKEELFACHGPCPIELTIHFDGRGEVDIMPRDDLTVTPGADFNEKVRKIFPEAAISVRVRPPAPPEAKNGREAWRRKKEEEAPA